MKLSMRPTIGPDSEPTRLFLLAQIGVISGRCGPESELQQVDLDVEREGALAARAVEERNLVLDGPRRPQPLPDAVGVLVEAVIAGVVAPDAGDIKGFVDALPVFQVVLLVVALEKMGGEADLPPFLVHHLERRVELLLAGRVRVVAVED